MSGHSKWATIKHKKGAKDAKRGKLFSKLAKYISVAARDGGDPSMNYKLKVAVDNAKAQGLPKDNIARAIRRGSGEDGGAHFEEIVYEGVGAEGVQVMVDTLTDNRNRTTAEFRKMFEVRGGKLGSPKSVAWNFESKGQLVVPAGDISEEDMFDIVVEAGAENLEKMEDNYVVTCLPDDMENIKQAVLDKSLTVEGYQIVRIPKTSVKVNGEANARRVLTLMEELEDHDDVQMVSANYEIPDDIMEKLAQG